jgi:hypothetical protein
VLRRAADACVLRSARRHAETRARSDTAPRFIPWLRQVADADQVVDRGATRRSLRRACVSIGSPRSPAARRLPVFLGEDGRCDDRGSGGHPAGQLSPDAAGHEFSCAPASARRERGEPPLAAPGRPRGSNPSRRGRLMAGCGRQAAMGIGLASVGARSASPTTKPFLGSAWPTSVQIGPFPCTHPARGLRISSISRI